MGDKSAIEWTDATWNPVTGCTKVSPGCKHCYAERLAERLQAMGNERYRDGFRVALHPDVVRLPRTWKKPRRVFVNSMSDLWHEDVPMPFIETIFWTMSQCPQHTFQILTKRSWRLQVWRREWPPNVWQGVSIEDARVLVRVHDLAASGARMRFLSCEPLIGPIPHLPLERIHWVIVGGESGPDRRPMDLGWAREIRNQCLAAGVPFFMKQLGGARPGTRLEDLPDDLRIRQVPQRKAVSLEIV